MDRLLRVHSSHKLYGCVNKDIQFADHDKEGKVFFCFCLLRQKRNGHYCHSRWRSCPGGWIVRKTKLVAYGSHYLPLWLKARVCPPASIPGLRPSHRPQLFLLVPVYHLIMCALSTIVVRSVCIWRGEGGPGGRETVREKETDDKCEKSMKWGAQVVSSICL